MKKPYNLILGLVIGLFLLGCDKDEYYKSSDVEYVKYGTSFGECLGYCKNDIAVTSSTIIFTQNGWNLEGALPENNEVIDIELTKWTDLIEKINFNSFSRLDPIIGCPDCADGGAEWIEIKHQDHIHKVTFEYYNEPETVKAYIDALRGYLNSFQKTIN